MVHCTAVILFTADLASCDSLEEIVHTKGVKEIRPDEADYFTTVQIRYLGVGGVSMRLRTSHVVGAPLPGRPSISRSRRDEDLGVGLVGCNRIPRWRVDFFRTEFRLVCDGPFSVLRHQALW